MTCFWPLAARISRPEVALLKIIDTTKYTIYSCSENKYKFRIVNYIMLFKQHALISRFGTDYSSQRLFKKLKKCFNQTQAIFSGATATWYEDVL